MLRKIIDRPVTATVVSIILVVLGVLAIRQLPMETFPEIAPPAVAVKAQYPGANAEAIARSVAIPLEQAINGVENMLYMTSSSSNDGTLTITTFFELGTDPDQAAINVQNRVSQATNQLPREVLEAGIVTNKQSNSMIMIVDIESTNPQYDATFLNNFALINVLPGIQRIPGVGKAEPTGRNQEYAMRVWLNPAKLAAYKMSPQEVMAAIQGQNLEAAPGRFGEGSPTAFEFAIKYKGKLSEEKDYENIVVRAENDASVLRLKDVGRVELGLLNNAYATGQTLNGNPAIGIQIFQTPGSNAKEIQIAVEKYMEEIQKTFPEGLHYRNSYNSKRFLDASIKQVTFTLIEAFILVFIVVFIFLQDLRSTLIPIIAVPVSIIGTFFIMAIFGFTINMLTLFALVLAIGIVVDDAIVVVEAVHSKLANGNTSPKQATISAMSEITGAIFSITLVMAAVFLPIGLMDGPVGVFYRQFAFTLAIAIILSAINALTLSPALCVIFLRNHETIIKENLLQRFYRAFNAAFHTVIGRYTVIIRFLIKRKWIAGAGLVLVTIGTIVIANCTQRAFIPTEDQSFVTTTFTMPPNTSFARTKKMTDEAVKKILAIDAVELNATVNGNNLFANAVSPSYAASFTVLKPPKERGNLKDIDAVIDSINSIFSDLPEGNVFTFSLPTVPGFSNVDALDVVLKDNTGGSISELAKVGDEFIASLTGRNEIATAFTTFNASFPQYKFAVDDVKAKQNGLETADVLKTMQAYYGSIYASDFNRFGKYYRVVLQAEAPYRMDERSLNNVYAKNKSGDMIPVTSIARLEPVMGAEVITRLNMATSINVNVQAAGGFSTGDAMDAINEVATKLPAGYSIEYIGMAKEEQNAGNQTVFIFSLCILFVYLLLSAQYESYILPFAIILTLPTGVFGVFTMINMLDVTNNIYVQVALIMLIGLLAKNAILIVEFASQRRQAGMPLVAAAIEAARLRLRPILMTSFAFIAGMLPLLFAGGATEQGNRSIASGAIGGMLFGVLLGILIIPVLFVVFQSLHERFFGLKKPIQTTEE